MSKLALPSILTIPLLLGCHGPVRQSEAMVSKMENRRILDMRSLFRPQAQIEELKNRQVCSVKYASAPEVEIFVASGKSLKAVIKSFRGNEYDGQIRVVSQDTIVQTSRHTYNPSQQETIQVNPGDLVFVQARD